jgi:hypothetical protein
MGENYPFLLEGYLIQLNKGYLEKIIFVYGPLITCNIDLEATQLLPDMLLILHGVLAQ